MTEKKTYQAPAIQVMEFKVERGYATSNLGIGTRSYNTTSNSGDGFWGGVDAQMAIDGSQSGSGTTSYGTDWDFGW